MIMEYIEAKYKRDIKRLTNLLEKKVKRFAEAPGLARIQEVVCIATDIETACYVRVEVRRALREVSGGRE